MKNWENTEIETEVKQLQEIVVYFKYISTQPILNIQKSCGCTGYNWEDVNTLKVKVDTGFVKDNVHPKLYEQGKRDYIKSATLTVNYKDGTSDKLKVNARVYE